MRVRRRYCQRRSGVIHTRVEKLLVKHAAQRATYFQLVCLRRHAAAFVCHLDGELEVAVLRGSASQRTAALQSHSGGQHAADYAEAVLAAAARGREGLLWRL